jgi:glycolate oxidase iron-sulfur subunit
MKVGLFSGCSQEYLYPAAGEKLVHLLAAHGCEVHFPREQGCCGTPVITSGDLNLGREMADQNVAALEQYDYVISGCASCSSMLKEYEHLLGDTAEREKRYAAFGAKVRGVSEFIFGELDLDPSKFTVRQEHRGSKVTWHDPCHLVRYQNVREQPRKLLRGVEGIEYVEMPNADKCCGMAGTFTLYYYDTSKKIGDRKADGIEATGADIVVTECPGCIMQITDTLARRGMPHKVMHILELFE